MEFVALRCEKKTCEIVKFYRVLLRKIAFFSLNFLRAPPVQTRRGRAPKTLVNGETGFQRSNKVKIGPGPPTFS